MSVEEYLTYLDVAYASKQDIDPYLAEGADLFWQLTGQKQGLAAPKHLLKMGNQGFIDTYYEECFQRALYACQDQLSNECIRYKALNIYEYDASTKRLGTTNLLILDSALYTSFIVYFTCIFLLSFLDDLDTTTQNKIINIFAKK